MLYTLDIRYIARVRSSRDIYNTCGKHGMEISFGLTRYYATNEMFNVHDRIIALLQFPLLISTYNRDRRIHVSERHASSREFSFRLQELDTRIIIGSFSSRLAQRVFCEVSCKSKYTN